MIKVIFDDDKGYIQRSANELRHKLKGANTKYKEFQKYGHFTFEDMQSEKFSELLEESLRE
jgi:hypothetical protein